MARTLTISDETAAVLDAEAARTKRPVEQLVDEMLRQQLVRDGMERAEPFRIEARLLRTHPGTNFNFDKLEALLDEVEGPLRK